MTALSSVDTGATRSSDFRGWFARAFPLLVAYIYASTLAALPIDVFNDRDNYLTYAQYSDVIFIRYEAEGLLSILANEPVWLFLNTLLAQFLFPDGVVRVLIFVPAFVVAWQLLRHEPAHAIWIIAFLLAPQVVKNHIVHLRQGVAIAVFMTGYFAKPSWLRYSLMLIAPLIHSSFVFVLTIGAMVWAVGKLDWPPRIRMMALIAAFVAITAMVSFVAGSVGARQAFLYAFAELDITGVGFLFWLAIFGLFLTSKSEIIDQNMFGLGNLAFYLVSYFVIPVSARIFESGLFLVLLAGLKLPTARKYVFVAVYILFGMIQYITRLDLPWLGWGRLV